MLFLIVSETREAVREDQKCRRPEANENTEKLAVRAGFKRYRFSAGIIPDGDGGEDRGEAENEAEVTKEFHRVETLSSARCPTREIPRARVS